MTIDTLPSRFLNLPRELRLIIYEHLDISTKHYELSRDLANGFTLLSIEVAQDKQSIFCQHAPVRDMPSITLTTYTLPVQILAACRFINIGATPILRPLLTKLKRQVPTLTVNVDCLHDPLLYGLDSFLSALLASLNAHCRPSIIDGSHAESSKREQQQPDISPATTKQTWVSQTAAKMLAQASPSRPSNPSGASAYPQVRLLLHIRKTRPFNLPPTTPSLFDGHCGLPPHTPCPTSPFCKAQKTYTVPSTLSAPPIYTISTNTKLTHVLNRTMEVVREEGLDRIKCGSIVFGQNSKKQTGSGLEVTRVCALEYEVEV
ncbi:uncharacterized protein K460DRAFT_401104 [Cucurbitaria berberidis CBS 394.84]|uniref:Uncharacterized protein n=1 Tax=Cucurbitaria berberidis CBS 394.84 TaxID=1168544 RepID=A0A9P4LE63_9PLEO|nr:uncharacterized protein K460DRAFT_401104 [Cucurbitaria berberidis CBS 394.84]KAF1851077.1 hypothetical protein K460DRAFT_401104 [Cucurbitaria berberidis CBS 394.84]